MGVPRGTTPTFTLTFPETVDLTQAHSVHVTFASEKSIITKTGDDIEVSAQEINVYLTQCETFALEEGSVKVQVNWMVGNDRVSSVIKTVKITKQLLERVIS